MDKQLVRQLLHRSPSANKYDFGHLLVVGGSVGMSGAPLLTAEAALRIGCGMVTIATDEQTAHDLVGKVEEVMTLPLPSKRDLATATLDKYILQRKVTAIVLGPGLGPQTSDLTRSLTRAIHLPIVVDAGSLVAFSGHLDELQKSATVNHSIVLTPHAGEYARLTGISKEADLRADAQTFAAEVGVHVVLKGDHTLVVHPAGRPYRNQTGNPGLATAGTGDVLAGVIGGLLAQGVEVTKASEVAVYLHGLAGDLAAEAKTEAGIIASDIIDYMPDALKQCQ